jgi:hypothetical protein
MKIPPVGKNSIPALALIAALALPAQAQVAFEPGVGGSVGAEEVQGAFGWSDRHLRAQGRQVSFTYEMTDWYAVACRSRTVEGEVVETVTMVSRSTILDVESTPRYEPDRDGRRQLTGYDLMGYRKGEKVEGRIPDVGSPCEGTGSGEGRVTRSELEHVRDYLYVNSGDMKVGIWFESY